ncbi:hypothetical protein SPRG_03019 [Saprolegnia parasitica CBS 223.65]|uniref:Uncharacterized protein n=1 Tax=Saprolegnia parasitica (strain CBS 223.65) TaxID=695850 RepID=A0A067CPB5_SAPPC|nr:hypothetical protein SPRG_03019 [Saprolegnia parasitica CBS 223.65]KDO32544.1 hypothetical protein SPRG_03019 [Saprolegnia parasitica CBS 223.65]|eukprot:XP_012196990.1 hypothetical protein SPRG_03019 [Saprolegnia parasitica CBS 223.65]
MHWIIPVVILGVWLPLAATASPPELFALDGNGDPVAWWVVLKLPSMVRGASGAYVATPCDCAPPVCSREVDPTRRHGLCYLYADANRPQLQHFRALGYDCLGQGGRDPVSQTLRQRANATHWAYFNDQLNGIALKQDKSLVCSGHAAFNAHSKGLVAFEATSGGFVLQTSTPNFPDPTPSLDFERLGCQHDNNVEYAQHLFAFSVGDAALATIASGWRAARLCSANHYHAIDNLLVSPSLRNASALSGTARVVASVMVDPHLPAQPFVQVQVATKGKQSIIVHGLFKSRSAEVPPWALVATAFATDVSVASWWDENYGTPTLCDGDSYGAAAHAFCLRPTESPVALRPDGTFQFNVENLMDASWTLPTGRVTWSLRGGRVRDGNHAKWGIATPRHSSDANLSIFGDLNMEGFPCSSSCAGSQGGRGGTFFALANRELHDSLAALVTNVCGCGASPAMATYVDRRLCGHGCTKKLHAAENLPGVGNSTTSYWPRTESNAVALA